MQVARRIYVYLVSFISLQMLLAGATTLLRLLLEMALGISRDTLNDAGYLRQQFSLSGSILLVGALVWIIHWMLARRSAAPSNPDADQERRAVSRKLLIYAVLFVSLWEVFFALAGLLRDLTSSLLATATRDLSESLANSIPAILVYGTAWLYYWRVRAGDNSLTPEEGPAATVRRWYFYLVSYGALSALMYTASDLGRQFWRVITGAEGSYLSGGSGVGILVAGDAGWIVVSFAVWLLHWLAVQRLTASSSDEQHSVLRKVYIYLVVFQTLSVTMTTLAFFLNSILRLMLGTNPLGSSGDSLLTQAGGPLVTALVYGLFWTYHWQVLKWDASLVAEEPPRQASIRRAYHYLVALVALSVLAAGVSSLLQLLIDLARGSIDTNLGRQAMGDQISLAATLIVVGTPIWYVNWAQLQRRALAPGGAEERHALLRRIYLYVILFFSVVALLASAGSLVYQLLLTLGGGPVSDLLNNLAGALAPTITACLLLVYHLRVLLEDGRARAAMPAAPVPEPQIAGGAASAVASTVLLVRYSDPAGLNAAIEEFRSKLPPGVQLDVFGALNLTPEELGSWLASPFPDGVAPSPTTPPTANASPAPYRPPTPVPPPQVT